MIRKIFKWSLKIIIGVSLFFALIYSGFHLWEYSTGNKFVAYLSQNSETISLDDKFSYSHLDNDIENKQLILVGEIHGFKEPSKFDIDLFKFLHENHNVNHYLAELDFVQASLLNKFLKTGNEESLSKILNKWVVVQGRNNEDYFDKYKKLHQYYKELDEDDKFKFIGIDKIQDGDLLNEYLYSLYPKNDIITKDSLAEKSIGNLIKELTQIHRNSQDTLFILSHIKTNVLYIEDKTNREEVLFLNFSKIYKYYNLQEHKLYGYFGLYHVFQYRINGKHPLASKIRTSDLGLKDKVMSINMMMNDSYMIMPSNQLPDFMKDKGKYTRMPVSVDNMLFMYIVGVKDFKRMTPEKHKSLIKMDGTNNPYANSIRLNKTIQILPVTDIFEMTDKGKPYVQYTLFIRGSDWAEPMK
jgi:hypothetical protein